MLMTIITVIMSFLLVVIIMKVTIISWLDGWYQNYKWYPRYTSGIPNDAITAKDYDDGRSSNVSSNTWAPHPVVTMV